MIDDWVNRVTAALKIVGAVTAAVAALKHWRAGRRA
jgi:hypothetical protein